MQQWTNVRLRSPNKTRPPLSPFPGPHRHLLPSTVAPTDRQHQLLPTPPTHPYPAHRVTPIAIVSTAAALRIPAGCSSHRRPRAAGAPPPPRSGAAPSHPPPPPGPPPPPATVPPRAPLGEREGRRREGKGRPTQPAATAVGSRAQLNLHSTRV